MKSSKRNWKDELAKLKPMTWSNRIWYIWEYYKIQIFAMIVIIFLIYETIACVYRNLQDTMLYCVTVNETQVNSSMISPVQKEFEAKQGYNQTWKQNTVFDVSLSIDNSNEDMMDRYYSTASNIKFESLVATNTIDVLITVPYMHTYYTSQDLFVPLNEALSDELYSRLEAEDLIVWKEDYNGQTIAAGILLDNSYLAGLINLQEQSTISVCTLENHPEVIEDFIYYALWNLDAPSASY